MSTGTVGGGLPLDQSQELHQALSLRWVIPNLAQMRCAPHRTLNSKYLDIGKTSLMNFGCQLFRTVEVGSREIGSLIRRVAVLPRGQIICHDLAKPGIAEQSSSQSVNQRSKAGNRGSDEHALSLEDAVRFPESQQAIRAFHKVIQGAQQENCVGTAGWSAYASRVAFCD